MHRKGECTLTRYFLGVRKLLVGTLPLFRPFVIFVTGSPSSLLSALSSIVNSGDYLYESV